MAWSEVGIYGMVQANSMGMGISGGEFPNCDRGYDLDQSCVSTLGQLRGHGVEYLVPMPSGLQRTGLFSKTIALLISVSGRANDRLYQKGLYQQASSGSIKLPLWLLLQRQRILYVYTELATSIKLTSVNSRLYLCQLAG